MFDQFTEPENLLALLTAVGVFASILVVVMPMLKTDPLNSRMKSVALEREKLRAKERAKMANTVKDGRRTGAKKREPGALIKLVVDKLNLRKALADELLFGQLTDGGRLTVDLDDKDEIALDIQPLPERKGRNKAEEAAAS